MNRTFCYHLRPPGRWPVVGHRLPPRPYGLRRVPGLDRGDAAANRSRTAAAPGDADGESTRLRSHPDQAIGEDEDPSRRRRRLEAILLMAKSPLSTRKLAQLAHLADGTEARTLVRELNRLYDSLGRALRIEQVAGGYRMMTRPALAPWLVRLGHLPPAVRLSSPMMETLTVVAYRQPVSRADIEAIRGVNCGELLRQLLERDLIRIAGRGEELGRPYLYGTTKRFLQIFGLTGADALPTIDWHTLEADTADDPSSPPKESAVSTAAVPVALESRHDAPLDAVDPVTAASPSPAGPVRGSADPRGVIEDEEDEIYEGGNGDDDLDDEVDDDWDDDEEDEEFAEDEDDDEEDDDDDEGLDDEPGEEWVEVGDDGDEEWDDDDDDEEDDDDWEEDDDEEWD